MNQDIKRRFIAGAVCPACQAVDRIVVESSRCDAGVPDRRHCVSCGFEDRQPEAADQGAGALEWPASRLEHGRRTDVAPAPVRLLAPGPREAVEESENDSRNRES